MCEQTEINYLDGEVVWVKLGSCWWPGEVIGPEKLPPDVLPSFKKPPIAVVKFFQESTYEYVKNINSIYKYQCSRKDDFIKKGLYMYRSKLAHMEKFPEDVIRAETEVGGDPDILTREEFQEAKKESYAGIFGTVSKKGNSAVKAKASRKPPMTPKSSHSTPVKRGNLEKSDYKVHILVQGTKTPSQSTDTISTPSTSRAESESETVEEKTPKQEKPVSTYSTPTSSTSGVYPCPLCAFTTTRLNVLILHNKTHSATFTPYTPSPVRKKPVAKSPPTVTPNKTPKARKPRKEKTEKVSKKSQAQKRPTDELLETTEVKKAKTDEEIKSSLLADWDDMDEDSNDKSIEVTAASPEVPAQAASPAEPTPAELTTPIVPEPAEKSDALPNEKPELSSDSKYEFCEDEDWPVEADAGRKIPRIKNPTKRKEERKSINMDDDDMAREVAELLNRTTMPDLPSAPEPLTIEENFPEPSIVKSPDKKVDSVPELKVVDKPVTETQPTKAIFKTKTFFRSRHSRSQDAIGKYVAEQLNAAERMDAESELNGSEFVPSPETRQSPPVEHVKVARLAPKIQLKKMKAEAAQLREKEKTSLELIAAESATNGANNKSDNLRNETVALVVAPEVDTKLITPPVSLDVLYPTQEIKPINRDIQFGPISTNTHTKIEEQQLNCMIINSIVRDKGFTSPEKAVGKSKEGISNVDQISEYVAQKVCTQSAEPFMNESTACAVDALLSVSREADRVTKTISDDLPEDLFEDDNKDNAGSNNFNGFTEESKKVGDHLESVSTVVEEYKPTPTLVEDFKPMSTTVEEFELTAKPLEEFKPMSTSVEEFKLGAKPLGEFKPMTTSVEEFKLVAKPLEEFKPMTTSVEEFKLVAKSLEEFKPTTTSIEELKRVASPDQELNDMPTPFKKLESTATFNETSQPIATSNKTFEPIATSDETLEPIATSDETLEPIATSDETSEPMSAPVDEFKAVPTFIAEIKTTARPVEEAKVMPMSVDEFKPTSTPVEEMQWTKSYIQNNNTEANSDITEIDKFKDSEIIMTEDKSELQHETVTLDNVPSESDLQIAEALINLPATAIQNKVSSLHQENLNLATHFAIEPFQEEEIQSSNNIEVINEKVCEASPEMESVVGSSTDQLVSSKSDSHNTRYETEEEKSENLYAAQSLVEMSESIEHKIKEPGLVESEKLNIVDTLSTPLRKVVETTHTVEQKIASLSSDNNSDPTNSKAVKFETSSSKLLKILEEPCIPKVITKTTPTKQVMVTGKEKILNFDVSRATMKGKTQPPKQKIIIRRNTPSKHVINNLTEISSQDIILSRCNKPTQDGTVQTYTIQATPSAPEPSSVLIQQKVRKIAKPAPKLQKLKQQFSLVTSINDSKPTVAQPMTDDSLYDINSMPIVLSDDILTPENIEKMPIVMSDGKIITNTPNPPKLLKTKHIESDKIQITSQSKPELKTLLMNPVPEVSKATTPNILSKSSKLRGSKPMLVIDKATGKQKIIMTKPETTVKEIKQAPPKVEPPQQSTGKSGKFIVLPSYGSPRQATRTQKIVIDPQTGKAHVLVAKGPDGLGAADTKPVSAKLIPQASDAASPGNTVMIITNAQGAQSRIVLTPEHEKILFPNKQQPKVSQLKTVTHRITTPSAQKTIMTAVGASKTQTTKMVPKQKSAIITSKGQLIVGGRVATTSQNIAPMPEIRPKQRIIAAEPRKLAQTVQKTSSEPLIFLQQKSGQVMQLTAAQFEHLQRTGQIIQKTSAVQETKVVQKTIMVPANEAVAPAIPKKMRRPAASSPTPAKRVKQEIAIAPAPALALTPALAPAPALATAPAPSCAPVPALAPLAGAASYSGLDNFEELLPSTAIARPPSPAPEPAPAPLADGQLLAVPGEHFGGPPGSFYLCVEEAGSLTPIDNRPLVLEHNQLVPMGPEPAPAPERRDILEAALANSDVFREPPRDEPPFRELNAAVSGHCRVSETSSTHQPIMTPAELPSLAEDAPPPAGSLEAGLAQIGVTPHVPTTLQLPITVTDPRIAPRAADPLAAPPADLPLLLEEDGAGKSMPLLTDEPLAEPPDHAAWSRRLLAPGEDAAEDSAEIPLQPAIRLSASDLARDS